MRCLVNMEKRLGMAIIIVAMVLVLASMALAVDRAGAVSGASVTKGISSRLTAAVAQSDDAQAGNVTQLNLSTSKSTAKWAGYFGQVSATLALGIGSDQLFSFGSAANDQIVSVLASTDTGFNFGNLVAATAANVDTIYGFAAADIDSGTLTLDDSTPTIAGVSTVPAANLRAHTGAGTLSTSIYQSGVLADTAGPGAEGDLAFGVSTNSDERDFANATVVDYELIVPISGGDTGVEETYYFFLDLQ